MNNVDKLTISSALIKQALDAGDHYDVGYNPKIQAALGALGGIGGGAGRTLAGLGSGGYAAQDGIGTGIGHGLLTAGAAGLGAGLGRFGFGASKLGFKGAKGLAGLGIGAGKAVAGAGAKGAEGVGKGILSGLTNSPLGKKINIGVSNVSKGVESAGETGIGQKLKGLLSKAKPAVDDVVQPAKEIAEGGVEKVKNVADDVASKGKEVADDVADGAKDVTDNVAEALPQSSWGGILGGLAGGGGAAYGLGENHKAKMEAKALMEDPSIKGMILRKLQEMGV